MKAALVTGSYLKVHPTLVGAQSTDTSVAPADPSVLIPLKVHDVPDPKCPPGGLLIDVKVSEIYKIVNFYYFSDRIYRPSDSTTPSFFKFKGSINIARKFPSSRGANGLA